MAAVLARAGPSALFSRTPGASSPGVQEALQNEHRGYLIDDRSSISRKAAGSIQVTMRLGGRKPFVPERNLGPGLKLQSLGKGLRLESLGADVTRHVKRIAHHHLGAAISAHQASQGGKILAPILAHQGEHGLRGEPQFVGDRHPDAAVSDIQTQDPALGDGSR